MLCNLKKIMYIIARHVRCCILLKFLSMKDYYDEDLGEVEKLCKAC